MVKPLRVTWPYAALVWCCANTCQPTQPTFSEPPKTRTMKGLLQTPPSGKLGAWLGFWGESKSADIKCEMSHESCVCWCCFVWCTYRTCTRSTHIWFRKYRNMHHWIVCRDTSGSKRERYPERSKSKTSAGIFCKKSRHELIWTIIPSQKILLANHLPNSADFTLIWLHNVIVTVVIACEHIFNPPSDDKSISIVSLPPSDLKNCPTP